MAFYQQTYLVECSPGTREVGVRTPVETNLSRYVITVTDTHISHAKRIAAYVNVIHTSSNMKYKEMPPVTLEVAHKRTLTA